MKTPASCRVLVWGRDAGLGSRIRRALVSSPSFAGVAECVTDRRAALESLADHRTDVLLIVLSAGEGLGRLGAARTAGPDTPVVVLLPPGRAALGLKALDSGAAGVLTQPRIDTARLTLAIHVALRSGKRERDLRNARDQAEQATRAKSEFLATMSHEIRTPIHAILASTELLLETNLDDEQREYAGTTRTSASILLGLVNDVLDFSRIEAGKLSLESIDYDLASEVEGAVELAALEAHRKGLELVARLAPGLPNVLTGDPARLRQVLLNVVNNAVKFTSEGEVVVSVRPVSEVGDAHLEFSVRDTGIGIAADKVPQLFQTFSQLDSATNRKFGGTGLGLAISRSLVELMGGRVGVESRKGEGSRFWFTLPGRGADAGLEPPMIPPGFFGGLRVLVVDDNGSARSIMQQYLASWGCATAEARNGIEALAALRAQAGGPAEWQLAVIDLRMPGMDGWQLAREIRADPAIGGIRLVLASPLGVSTEDAKLKLAGWFNGYLTKPVRRQKLAETVFAVTEADLGLEPLPTQEPAEEPLPPGTWRVLVVDDSEVSRELFRTVLEKAGYRVETAADGAEAITRLSSHDCDLVFIDLNMPGMSGMDAVRRMREQGIRTTVIGVSAGSSSQERDGCLAAGMNDFLPKPFRRRDLARTLAAWLPAGGHPETKPATAARSESPAPRSGVPRREVFDRDEAVATFLGHGDLVDRLLRGLIERARTGLKTIRDAAARADAEVIRSEAHAVKGAALNLSAHRLAEVFLSVERYAKDHRLDDAALILPSLERAIDELEEAVRGSRSKGDAGR